MKPIIIDINEMSDSSEVYYSKPNKWISIFIYLIFIVLITGLLWAYFSTMDIVVKSSGIVKTNSQKSVVSSDISGRVNSLNVTDGQFINKGDIILELDSEKIKTEVQILQDDLDKTNERIEILNAYNDYLLGNNEALSSLNANSYYEEFMGKKMLLELGNKTIGNDNEKAKAQYNAEISNLNNQINQNTSQISKIESAIKSINNGTNHVSSSDSYYYTLVNSYLSNYNIVMDKYDSQIKELKSNKENLENQIISNKEKVESLTRSIEEEEETEDTDEKINMYKADIENLNKIIIDQHNKVEKMKVNINNYENDKQKELSNLNLQQIAALEQEKNSIKSGITTLQSNKNLIENQLRLIDNSSDENTVLVNVETEKQNISKELMSYQEKRKDLEENIQKFDIEDNKAIVVANKTGYITFTSAIKQGTYLSQGQEILTIFPENIQEYNAELYVQNEDIGKIKENQQIKIEIPAYPSNEYGFINGVIASISKETKVNETTGQSFYIVTAKLNNDSDENNIKLTNEMILQARIVVDEKRVITYLLEKINLWD